MVFYASSILTRVECDPRTLTRDATSLANLLRLRTISKGHLRSSGILLGDIEYVISSQFVLFMILFFSSFCLGGWGFGGGHMICENERSLYSCLNVGSRPLAWSLSLAYCTLLPVFSH